MVKISVKHHKTEAPAGKNNGNSKVDGRTGYVPPTSQPAEQHKGILGKMLDIIVSDFKGPAVRRVKGDDESWKDWEGQLK